MNLPSTESTPRTHIETPPYKPLLGDDYVMYEPLLLKGIDWNAQTPSPIESPHTKMPNVSTPTRQSYLSKEAAALSTTPLIDLTRSPKPTTADTSAIETSKARRKVIFNEENFSPRYHFSEDEVDDWKETLGDIHREAFDRSAEFAWDKFIFDFTPNDVTSAILFLLEHKLVIIYNDYNVDSISSYLTPYIVDATNALAAAQSNPNTFNEICSNYLSNSMEDINEDDYLRI